MTGFRAEKNIYITVKKTLVHLFLIMASIFWGASFIITKQIFADEPNITVLQLLTFRLLLASAVTIPLLVVTRQLEPMRRGDMKWFMLLALSEPFLYSICETNGVRFVSGSLASVIIATIPFFVAITNAYVYKERLRGVVLAGILLSLLGVSLMIAGDKAQAVDTNANMAKGLLFLASAVAIAVVFTLILVKVSHNYRATTITAYQNLIGCLYFLPVMLAVDGHSLASLHYTPRLLLLILSLGILCSTVAYMFYNHGVKHLGATAACVYANTIPVFSFLVALTIRQECFSWMKLVGIVMVVIGATMAQLPPSKKKDTI